MQGWLKPGDKHGQADTLVALQPAPGTLQPKSLLAAVGMSWLCRTAAPASPAPSSPGCPTSLRRQSHPNHTERAGAAPDLTARGGEHPHPPTQKPPQCLPSLLGHSLGLFPRGRAWDKGRCSFPLPFHLRQELSAVCAGAHVAPELLRVFPRGEEGGEGSQHYLLLKPALLGSHRELMEKR